MGNRAVITFDKHPTKNSLGIYLHWNGGAESVLAFVEAADALNVRSGDDYELARITQIICNWFGGTLSVGVGRLEQLDCSNHDNGLFRVSRNGKGSEIHHSPSGKLDGPWEQLDPVILKQHAYWQPSKDGKGEPILQQVIAANKPHFNKKD